MSFIPMNINDAQEAKPVPAGIYDLVISKAEVVPVKGKEGVEQFKITFEIDGHDEAAPVANWMGLPEDPRDFKALNLKRLGRVFGINFPADGFDPHLIVLEMPGKRGKCELAQEEYEGRVNNKIVLPRLPDEGTSNAGRGAPPKRRAA